MRVGTYTRMGFSLVCLLIAGGLWFVVPAYLFVIKKCIIVCDSSLAPGVREPLINFVKNYSFNKPFHSFSCEVIKQKFPLISHIDSTYAEGSLYCSFKTVRPCLSINNQYLLMEDNSVQHVDQFTQDSIAALPTIMTCQEGVVSLPTDSKNFLRKVPYIFFERFSLRWIDHTSLYLRDKQAPNIFMRANSQSIFDERLLTKYDKVKSEIVRQRYHAKKQWVVDVRFKNQIIVAQKGVEDL